MTRARLIMELDNREFVYWSRYFDRLAQAEELERLRMG